MITVILTSLLVVSIVSNIFLYKALSIWIQKVEIYESWILEYKNIILETYQELKNIDDRQIFEKDDEVGFVFSSIVDIIKDLKEKIYDDDNTGTSTPNENQNQE